jgi:hypothetical protein
MAHSPRRVVAFLRDRGAICYDLALFYVASELAIQGNRFTEILKTNLDWYWTSDRTERVSGDSPVKDLPSPRRLTRLSESTVKELLSDFDERNVDGYGRHIAILGVDEGQADNLSKDPQIRAYLMKFAIDGEGPIRIVIFQENDGLSNQVFVPRKPVPEVTELLRSWDIQPESIGWLHRHKYSRLGVIRLENMIPYITSMAVGKPCKQ